MAARFRETTALKRDIERDLLASTAAERARRHLVRLLDWAMTVLEEVNLGRRSPQDLAPRLACALTEQLEAIAGVEVRRPGGCATALERLFELQELYLVARAEPEGEDGGEEETVDVVAMSDAELARAIKIARATGTQPLEAKMESVAAAAGVSLEELRGPGPAVARLVAARHRAAAQPRPQHRGPPVARPPGPQPGTEELAS